MSNPGSLLPRVMSPGGSLPFGCTDMGQTTGAYSNAYSTYTYSPYPDSYTAAAVAAAKARPSPYSRNMDYGAYPSSAPGGAPHRMNGLYPRSSLGYGYEAR